MSLSQDLINKFVQLTKKEDKPKETTVNGTYKIVNGEEFVQIDGSEILTPVTSTVEAETGERVKVIIKNHTAIVTNNISSPSARTKSVQALKDEVDEHGNSIKQLDNTIEQQNNSIIQIDNNIKQVNNSITQANNAINQQGNIIKQLGNDIDQQGNVIKQMNNDIEQYSNEITQINNTVEQQNNTIKQQGNMISQQNNIINQQNNTISQHGNTIEQFDNTIKQQSNKIEQIDNEINQQGNSINQLNNKIVQQDNVISQHRNIIDQQDNIITEHGNNITILNSGFSIIDGVLVGLSKAIIDELKTKHLDAEYADVDFANINFAAVKKLFTESGIIKDLVVQEGKITGELVGVTIKGDLIEGNTIRADKLVVKGENGLYYKLNLDGLNNISTSQANKFELITLKPDDWDTNYKDYYTISNDEYVHVSGDSIPEWTNDFYYKLTSTYETGLDGSVIVAKSVTADKVSVNDLVAFGATIGGFNITDHSIYSGGKSDVNNVAQGLYMDDSGQMSFGDIDNFVKYFKDTDGKYKLRIKADELYTSSSSESIADQIKDLQENGVPGSSVTVKSIEYAYQLSTSGTNVPAGEWSNTPLAPTKTEYAWTRTTTTFSDDKQAITYTIGGKQGEDGQNGGKGDNGADGRSVNSITRYYKTQASTVSEPTKPTKEIPDGWSDTEPTYTSGNTNVLYICDKYVFSDGTFQYTEVSKSSSYEAAKDAYNKAYKAQETVDNLKIGGRNYISHNPNNWVSGSWDIPSVGDKTSIISNASRISLKEKVEIEPNTDYWIKVYSIKSAIKVVFRVCDQDDNFIRSEVHLENQKWTSKSTDKYIHITVYENSIVDDIDNGITKIKLEKGNRPTDWTDAPEDLESEVEAIQADYVKETIFNTYKTEQKQTDEGFKSSIKQTNVTIYGNEDGSLNTEDSGALINHIQKMDNDVDQIDERLGTAENTLEGTGLNQYDQRVKITERFLNVETDVEQIKNIFKITGGTNLIQNSVGYFTDNSNKPNMWETTTNAVYSPFGYDADLTGATISRGKLKIAKGTITTTPNNIAALLSNKVMSISFKYKNGDNATTTIKVFNGSVTLFEKNFTSAVDIWTEYTFNADTDPVLANPTFICNFNSLQISISSSNSDNGFEISDLMLNYGDVKPWELCSNEVYGAMVKLSSLGIEVTATTAKTKNFMTTDGILVYAYDPITDKIVGTEPITKITDDGLLSNKVESKGDFIERDMVHTMINDSENHKIYVEYIR